MEPSKIEQLKMKVHGKGISRENNHPYIRDRDVKILKKRIAKGKKWLTENEDHPKFGEYLKLYESLVDELKNKYGETEPDLVEEVFGDEVEKV